MPKVLRFLFFYWLLAVGVLWANPKAILIFDASGSMWGQINKVPKITIAKDTLKKVIKSWDSSINLGVMVYGHRKKGDCSDIEMVFPIGKIDKKRVIGTISKISPKGKTPISRSLKMATDKLKISEDETTIILISDGRESCDANPCDTAKELKGQGINFVAHVIGFNVDKVADQELECIADATGGEYFSVKDASSLNKALKKVVKKVSKPKPKVKKKPKFDLEIRAKEKKGGKDVSTAYYYIYKIVDGEPEEDKTAYCYSEKKRPCLVKLPTGEYLIDTIYNKFKKKIKVKVDENNLTKLTLIMGQTGKLTINAKEKEGGKDVSTAYYYIYKIVDGESKEEKIDYCYSEKKRPCTVQLPVGEYLIKASYNEFKKDIKVKIKPKKNNLTVTFGQTGKLKIIAREREGGKWVYTFHKIYPVVDGKVVDETIARCSSREKEPCVEKLPVGKYLIVSEYNNFKKKTKVEINSSKTTTANIIMGQTGKLKIIAREREGGKWVYTFHKIYPVVDGKVADETIARCSSREKEPCVERLPVGKYLIVSEYNNFKKKTKVEINSSKTTTADIIMGQTGNVLASIRVNDKPSGGYIYIYDDEDYLHTAGWSAIRDGEVRKIKLPAGHYYATIKHKGKKIKREIDVLPSKNTEVETDFYEFTIKVKCPNSKDRTTIEVYSKDGQMVADRRLWCSRKYEMVLDKGKYRVEGDLKGFKKEAEFEVGSGDDELTIDFTQD